MIGYKDLVAFELARLTTFLPDKNIRRNIQVLYNEKFEITPAARNYTKLEISIDSSDGPYPRYRDGAGKIIRGYFRREPPHRGLSPIFVPVNSIKSLCLSRCITV